MRLGSIFGNCVFMLFARFGTRFLLFVSTGGSLWRLSVVTFLSLLACLSPAGCCWGAPAGHPFLTSTHWGLVLATWS